MRLVRRSFSASRATVDQRRSGWPPLSEVVSTENLATALPATRQPAIAIHQGSKKCERLGFLQLLRARVDSCRLHVPWAMSVQVARLDRSPRGHKTWPQNLKWAPVQDFRARI